jgi:hypothetical protein
MATKKSDSGEAEVQANVDAENEQGFRGARVDPTPLENYTARGVAGSSPVAPRPRRPTRRPLRPARPRGPLAASECAGDHER